MEYVVFSILEMGGVGEFILYQILELSVVVFVVGNSFEVKVVLYGDNIGDSFFFNFREVSFFR